MRPRTRNKNLPPCVYRQHGAYYLVKKGKWYRLGTELGPSLAEYARRMSGGNSGTMRKLLDETLRFSAERVKPNTLAQYQVAANKLSEIFSEFEPNQVTTRDVAQMMDGMRHTPNMANRLRSFLKIAFDRAVLNGLCDTNPVISSPRHSEKHRTRYLSDDEYRKIYSAAGPVLRIIMDLCYLTGQRIGDILTIQQTDIIENEGILFKPQKTDTLDKRLMVRMTPALAATIEDARRMYVTNSVPLYLLAQRNGRARSYKGVHDLFERACIRAEVNDTHLHDLRAKSLTDAKREGKDAQILGNHSTEAMTNRYIRGRETVIADGPNAIEIR